jgi:hypothetical protein
MSLNQQETTNAIPIQSDNTILNVNDPNITESVLPENNESIPKPKKKLFSRIKIPRYGLISMIREHYSRKRLLLETQLLKRDELMKQDLERYQMEIEEQHSWLAYELTDRNRRRLIKERNIKLLLEKKSGIETRKQKDAEEETGLSFTHGIVKSNRRPQNSPAKYLGIN